MKLKYLFATLLVGMFVSSPASAYVITITNATGQRIAVDIYGVLKPGGSFFNGQQPTEPGAVVEDFHATRTIYQAQSLSGPQFIEVGQTVNYHMEWFDVGVCFEFTDGIRVGTEDDNYSVRGRGLEVLPDQYMEIVTGAVSQTGDALGNMGKAFSQSNIPQAKLVGAGGQGLGGIISSAGKLYRASTCKNVSVTIIEDDEGVIRVLTRSIG